MEKKESYYNISDLSEVELHKAKLIRADLSGTNLSVADSGFRANLMKLIKKQFQGLHDVVDDSYQRILLEF